LAALDDDAAVALNAAFAIEHDTGFEENRVLLGERGRAGEQEGGEEGPGAGGRGRGAREGGPGDSDWEPGGRGVVAGSRGQARGLVSGWDARFRRLCRPS